MRPGTDYLARYDRDRRRTPWLIGLFVIVVAGLLLAHDWFFAAGWVF